MKKIFYGLLLLPALMTPCMAYSSHVHYGPTLENERLFRIALRIRPNANLTVQQVMVALLIKNPRAFNQPNINFLKSGYRLTIPDAAEIADISPKLALDQVEQQNRMWRQGGELAANKVKTRENVATFEHHIKDRVQESQARPFTAFLEINKHPFNSTIETAMTSLASTPEPGNENLGTFIENTHQYQEQTSTQIADLEQQTKNLEEKVTQLTEQLRAVTYHFIQLSAMIKKEQSTTSSDVIIHNLKKYGWSLGGCLFVLSLLIFAYQKTGKGRSSSKQGSGKVQDEYNFLEGEESIPTKLDLARAYIDMGDGDAAQSTLKDVLMKGDKTQRQTARDLLGKLNLSL